ncbi:MAG: glycerophosphodiester phosphodiesterase [Cryobacterium sp.]|nr:glycerophosphodiester phosphodiesterase [Cryobacterium sp.]
MPNSSNYLLGDSPRVLAHRGLAIEAPENTLLSFAKALALGVNIIETDVWASADGLAIISHDEDLKRVAGRDVRVDQLTARELSRIPLGEGQGLVTLSEALEAFPDARFNIDLKTDQVVDPAVDAIAAAQASNRVLLTSFRERRRRAAIRKLPDVATSLSIESVARLLVALRTRKSAAKRILAGITAVQIPERWSILPVLSPGLISLVHSYDVEVHVWTVNEEADMRRLLDLGVDGLVTDRADLAVKVIESRR